MVDGSAVSACRTGTGRANATCLTLRLPVIGQPLWLANSSPAVSAHLTPPVRTAGLQLDRQLSHRGNGSNAALLKLVLAAHNAKGATGHRVTDDLGISHESVDGVA